MSSEPANPSLVNVLDERGEVTASHLEKRGPASEPVRIIPAERKAQLELPEHLEVLDGSIDSLEDALRAV